MRRKRKDKPCTESCESYSALQVSIIEPYSWKKPVRAFPHNSIRIIGFVLTDRLSVPEKVQSMSLISIFHRLDAYNAQSSDFGGNDESEDSI